MTKYVVIKETIGGITFYSVMEYTRFKEGLPWKDFDDTLLVESNKEDLLKEANEILKTITEWEVYDV